jgi:AraC-like DNA-binding protein
MRTGRLDEQRGIVNFSLARTKFQLFRLPPAPQLAPFVLHYWFVAWDLRGEPPHRQQVVPYPAVNMTFLGGQRTRGQVAGVIRGHFFEELSGVGRVLGARFRPGGFRPFLGAPVARITDRFLGLADVFGPAGTTLERAVLRADDAPGMAAAVDEFLCARAPEPDPMMEAVAAMVDDITAEPALTTVDDLARRTGLHTRRLQRLFAEYVGVGPKWVIRRCRLQEAAERAERGPVDWAELAAELGYADQAHFTRDFTATVGLSPARYARECAAAQPG